jgi:hypothetical protein
MAEFRFAIESVNHVSVKEIADELERSEKAVWDMLGTAEFLPVPGWIQRARAFCEAAHPAAEHSGVDEIRRASQEEERSDRGGLAAILPLQPSRANKLAAARRGHSFWVSELLEAEKIRVNGAGTRSRANSRSSEGSQAAEASMPDDSASSTPEADPSEDLVSHNNRARGASPQR